MQKEPLHPLHPPRPKSVQSPANSFPIFSPPVSPHPPHLKNGVTFTALAEKCCQRLPQSAEKFQSLLRKPYTCQLGVLHIRHSSAQEV